VHGHVCGGGHGQVHDYRTLVNVDSIVFVVAPVIVDVHVNLTAPVDMALDGDE